jgi:hypothetical protein
MGTLDYMHLYQMRFISKPHSFLSCPPVLCGADIATLIPNGPLHLNVFRIIGKWLVDMSLSSPPPSFAVNDDNVLHNEKIRLDNLVIDHCVSQMRQTLSADFNHELVNREFANAIHMIQKKKAIAVSMSTHGTRFIDKNSKVPINNSVLILFIS